MTDTATVLRAAGLAVVDARIAGRGHLEIRGGMVHHDAIAAGITRSRGIQVMQQGRSDLPGPLCNAWLDRDGTWCLITDQRANHAGSCSSVALAEAFAGRISAATRDARDRALLDDTVIGNRYLYGIEVANNGVGEPYPQPQLDSLTRGIAALNAAWGLTSGHWLHHRQATRRKIDMSWRGDLWQMIDQHKEATMSTSPPLVAGHDGQGRWWRFKPIGDFGVELSESDARALVAVTPGAKIISHDQIEFLKRVNALVDRHGKVTR